MSETKNLKLFKHDEPLETNENKFDIDLALNQNWDKIEEFAGMVNDKVIELEDKNEEQDFNLQEQNTKLEEKIKKDRENMINLEAEGQSIHIEDSSNLEGQLEVLGNVEQDTREGYNLLKITTNNQTIYGVEMSIKENKTASFNGTATAETGGFSLIGTKDIPSTQFPYGKAITFFCEGLVDGLTLAWAETDANGEWLRNVVVLDYKNKIKQLTPTKGEGAEYIRIAYSVKANTKLSNVVTYPMYYEGTDTKEFEQYGASPSPEYPSEIRAVGDKGSVEIRKVSKNYFDKNNIFTSGGYKLSEENGEIVQEGNSEWKCLESYVEIKENCDYTLSGEILKSNWTISIWFYDKNKVGINAFKKANNGLNIYNFTTPKNAKYIRFIANSSVLNVSTIQLEEGETKTNHEEHQEETKILPIQKPMLEGDYFIKEVDGWKEVHEWDCYKFTGDENFEGKGTYNEFNVFAITQILPFEYKLQEYEKSGICNVFKTGKSISYLSNSTIQEGIQLYYNPTNVLRAFYLSAKEFKTVEELKAKIKEIDFKFYYEKQTPTKLPCTPEQTKVLDKLNNFQTYKPVTNITTDSIAKLKLKYIADTKTYVDNKTSNLEQQVSIINQLLSTTKTSSVLLDNLQTDIESEVL